MAQPPTPDDDPRLDVRLAWCETGVAPTPRRADDHYAREGGAEADEGSAEMLEVPPEVVPEGGDGRDAFEAAETRERAIEDAFSLLDEAPVSVVGGQLRRIRRAIGGHSVAPNEAVALIDEVRNFVELRLHALRERPEIAHEGMRQGRAAMEEALGLYLEISPLLMQYAESGEADLDALIGRLEDEATRAMQRARDHMESARPTH